MAVSGLELVGTAYGTPLEPSPTIIDHNPSLLVTRAGHGTVAAAQQRPDLQLGMRRKS